MTRSNCVYRQLPCFIVLGIDLFQFYACLLTINVGCFILFIIIYYPDLFRVFINGAKSISQCNFLFSISNQTAEVDIPWVLQTRRTTADNYKQANQNTAVAT